MDNQEIIQGIKIFGTQKPLKYKDGLRSRAYKLNNGSFEIDIAFGDVFWSEPPDFLTLDQYEKVCVSLFDYKEIDPASLAMKPMSFSHNSTTYNFNFDVHYIPAIPINIEKDIRFNNQNWDMIPTMDFANKSFGMLVSLDTMCEMIRYCYRLPNMKAFW